LLGLGDGSCPVSVSLRDDLRGIGLSLLNDLGLDELGLGNDLVVLQIGLSIDLIDQSCGLSLPLGPDPWGFGFDLLDFLRLLHLFEGGLLVLILTLLLLDLLGLYLLLSIVLDSLVVGESLSLESVLELENGLLLHGICDLSVQNYIGDNATLHYDSLVVQVSIEMLLHALSVLGSTERVCLLGSDGPCHGPHTLHDVGVDGLIDLGHICHQLLHIVRIWVNFQENGNADPYCHIIFGDHTVVWRLVHEVLLWDQVLGLSERGANHHAWLTILNEGSRVHDDSDGSVRTIFIFR
jgi:hypothetical protein